MDIASACLIGRKCRYDGESREDPKIKEMYERGEIRPVCPECLAGLESPRCPSEIVGGDGADVLDGTASVMGSDGTDRTGAFVLGAKLALAEAKACGARRAYMKAKSPSCGCAAIYDGSFSGYLKQGSGVASTLLKKHGIDVIEV